MEKKFVVLLCLVYLCSFETGWSQSENWSRYQKYDPEEMEVYGIVGGTKTTRGKYPFMIALYFKRQHWCGGSILNENWIITAAHCVENKDPQDLVAVAGLRKKSNLKDSQHIEISEIFIHENYNRGGFTNNDIALLKTAWPIDMSGSRGKVKSVRLSTNDEDPTGGALVIGWGRIKEDGRFSDILREVIVEMVDRKVCKETYSYLTENMICAGTNGKDSCQSDSGGPLFQYGSDGKPTVIGIVSFGRGCGRPGIPAVYVKVSNYKDWIKEITSK